MGEDTIHVSGWHLALEGLLSSRQVTGIDVSLLPAQACGSLSKRVDTQNKRPDRHRTLQKHVIYYGEL